MPKAYSRCTLRNRTFLQSLSKSVKKKHQSEIKNLLQNATWDQLNSITEVIQNTLKGNISYSPHQKKQLLPHKDTIRELGKIKLSKSKRKKLLQQRGGFLPTILAPVLIAIASELASKYL